MMGLMQKGKCPQCLGNEIFRLKSPGIDRARIPLSSMRSTSAIPYICLSCGYIEEYVDLSALKNEEILKKFKAMWEVVKPIED